MKKVISNPEDTDLLWQKRIEEELKERDKIAWKKVLSTKEGRWVLERILEMTGYRARTFTGNSWTFRNEGMREVGITINETLLELLGIEAVTLRQKAENEYINFQMEQKRIYDTEDNECNLKSDSVCTGIFWSRLLPASADELRRNHNERPHEHLEIRPPDIC